MATCMHLLLPLLAISIATPQSAVGQISSDVSEVVKQLLPTASIESIHQGLRARTFTCKQLIATQFWRAEALNSQLNAVIRFRKIAAASEAAAKDAAWNGTLHCIPVIIKDNIDVAGMPTTNGAAAFVNMTANTDAAVVAKLKQAGAIIIGKANMAEMSDSGIDSNSTIGGLCKNPWNQERSCLGSSGGSGAAVAAGLAVIGVGTDTEGSVIGPCAANGLVCVRPGNGTVFQQMLTGVYPAFSRQDSVGLMARSSNDFITAFDAVYDTNMTAALGNNQSLAGVQMQLLENFLNSWSAPGVDYVCDPTIASSIRKAVSNLQILGATVENFNLSSADLAVQLGQVFAATAAKPNCSESCMVQDIDQYLTRYSSTGPFRTTQDLVRVQNLLPATYQAKLTATLEQNSSEICNNDLDSSCKKYVEGRATVLALLEMMMGNASVIVMPFTAKLPQVNGVTPGLADQITPALNPYTGWPSITLPVAFAANKLPVAMVMLARPDQEQLLVQVAHAYQLRFKENKQPELQINAASSNAGFGGAAFIAAAAALAALVMSRDSAV